MADAIYDFMFRPFYLSFIIFTLHEEKEYHAFSHSFSVTYNYTLSCEMLRNPNANVKRVYLMLCNLALTNKHFN